MVDLDFTTEGVEVGPFSVAPTLLFKVRVANKTPEVKVQNVLLQCQVRIAATQRHYAPADYEYLVEVFGETHPRSESLRSVLWADTSVQVPAFENERIVDLPVGCSFDFNVVATKYLYSLKGDEVPVAFFFSGTVFYRDANDFLQMDHISGSKEATFPLPLRIWQDIIDVYYPGSAWLRISRKVFDEAYRYKRHNGFTSWDQTLSALLPSVSSNRSCSDV